MTARHLPNLWKKAARRCDWSTAKVLIVLSFSFSFSFSERSRDIVSNVGSDVWSKITPLIQRLQQTAGPHDRLDVHFSLQVNDKTRSALM